MGWGTYYQGYLSKITHEEIDTKIEDTESYIKTLRDELLILAASTPRPVKTEDDLEVDWADYIQWKFSQVFDDIVREAGLLAKLEDAKYCEEDQIEKDY